MKKRHSLIKMSGGACLALFSLIAVSCAQDGFDDDERWTTSVRNTQLETPAVDQIEIAASADESQTIISWPVVHGAGGYICSLYDVSNPDNPVVVDGVDSKLIDGCSLTIPREEDSKYKFSIRTAGNEELNNKEAETTSEKEFSTFTPTYTTIPDGVDLYQWFQENPVPVGEEANAIKAELYAESGLKAEVIPNLSLNYDLVPGGEYTLSQQLDFLGSNVTLRASKSRHAKLKVTGESTGFNTYAPFALKYLDIDCSESRNALVEFSPTPDEAIKGLTGTGDYYNIDGTMAIRSCNIEGVNGNFIYDGAHENIHYCLRTMIITDCNVHLTSSAATGINGNSIIYCKQGFINDLTLQNCTFWNNGDSNAKYFIQYRNNDRATRAGYDNNSVTHKNCTFYNIAKDGQWANYSGFNAQPTSIFVLTNSIFANCAKEIARRFIGGRYNSSTSYTFSNNTYLQDMVTATFDNESQYDQTGTAIKEVPDFKDPANGNFNISTCEQATKKVGDPRWLLPNE